MESKKQNKKNEARRYRDRSVVARGGREALGEMGEGVKRYKLAVIK